MGSVLDLDEKPFQTREDVKAEIKRCSTFATICVFFCFIFAILGVIGDALNTTLGLESMSWFLLAIVAGLFAIHPQMHAVAAKHLLYMAESKKE
ncbi:MAG: hypothetical protein MUO85_00425 [candidate division Zixibacteria bacterium]|nr:hypothetical protein [candidate division Zixibacteria bacterium]